MSDEVLQLITRFQGRLFGFILSMPFFILGGFVSEAMAVPPAAIAPTQLEGLNQYRQSIMPVFKEYCIECHGPEKQEAGLRLDQLNPDLIKGDDGEFWEEVLNQMNVGNMPPEDEPQPSKTQRRLVTDWVHHQIEVATQARRSTGGRNVLRRLTRYEYNNTMQDLLGIDLDFADRLPPEGAAKEGFVNNSLVLGTSSLHMEYFQKIAKNALNSFGFWRST